MKIFLYLPLLLIFPFTEIAITIFLTQRLGVAWAFLFFAVPAIIGLLILKLRYQRFKAAQKLLKEKQAEREHHKTTAHKKKQQPSDPEEAAGCVEVLFYQLITVLLLIPGVLSHILAFCLMLPGVQRWTVVWLQHEPGKKL